MLILSRRQKETIEFPEHGITVEVVQIKGNTAKIGIDAPDEVRVIRGEIDYELSKRPYRPAKRPVSKSSSSLRNELRKKLDNANLAIHLAQNQLIQGLSDNAERALDQALLCLEELEESLPSDSDLATERGLVREPSSSYRVCSKAPVLRVNNREQVQIDREVTLRPRDMEPVDYERMPTPNPKPIWDGGVLV